MTEHTGHGTPRSGGELHGGSSCIASRHGTRAAYTAGCRCPEARQAHREYAHYRKQRTAHAEFGAAAPFSVPVAQTIAALDQLRGTGWSLRRIAATSGIARDHLSRIHGQTNRPLRRVRWATHQKITALLERDLIVADGALVDAYATWQRVRGLIALGYPKVWIARQIGNDRALQLGEYVVTARNAEQIRALVDTYGATPGPSQRARDYAAAHGWTADLLWQADGDSASIESREEPPRTRKLSIDDDVDPVVVDRLVAGVVVPATTGEKFRAFQILTARGWTAGSIGEHLRLSPSARTLFGQTLKAVS